MTDEIPRRRPSKAAVIVQLVVAVGLVYIAVVLVTEGTGFGPPFLDVVFLIVAIGLLLFAVWNVLQLRRKRSLPPTEKDAQ